MAEPNPPPPTSGFQNKQTIQKDSDISPQSGKNISPAFWSIYERVANQSDGEFVRKYNGDMDALLIAAGLFSSISTAFIINMESILSPNKSGTTNAILMILVNTLHNGTFPEQGPTLLPGTGPSNTEMWLQTLAYTSLSTSLLAAFGAVMVKQWLGHFQISRFGRGTLHERCQRRQQKLDGLDTWHFSAVITILRVFLQLSLLFLGISVSANVWIQHHTIASVTMGTTAFGVIFFFCTFVASLKSPDCPFQTPMSTVPRRVMLPVSAMIKNALEDMTAFRKVLRKTWSWAGFLDRMRESFGHALYATQALITNLITLFVAYFSRIASAMRHTVGSSTNDPEAAGSLELQPAASLGDLAIESAVEQAACLEELDLGFLESDVQLSQVYAVQFSAVQWILDTSTDADIIAAVAGMIPAIEWPAVDGVTDMLDRLTGHFYACFDPTQQILPLAQPRAVANLKAMSHFDAKQDLGNPFYIYTNGDIWSRHHHCKYHMDPDHDFLIACSALGHPVSLHLPSLASSDCMWMAHMFTYLLLRDDLDPKFVALVIYFIGICLKPESPARLVADCLLLAGQLTGLPINQHHLARLDKSGAIGTLRGSVMNRTLAVLVGDFLSPEWHQNALQLIHPLLQWFDKSGAYFGDRCTCEMFLKVCFRLLEEHPGTEDEEQIRSKSISILLRLMNSNRDMIWDVSHCYSQAQFDLLVDYHVRLCNSIEYDAIENSFEVLERLHGSPSTQDLKRRYIETTIRFMGQEITCDIALRAACAVPTVVASMGQDDESFRERFSKALASAVLSRDPATRQALLDNNSFKAISFSYWLQVIPYLELLCTLSQEAVWQFQLYHGGHFKNCLVIADTPSSLGDENLDEYAVPVAHIFALIDASGDNHPFFQAIRAYPSFPLILRAWRYIFNRAHFFEGMVEDNWVKISGVCYLGALQSLTAYARRRFNAREESLIALVEQVCRILDEEKCAHEQDDAHHPEGKSRVYQGIPVLCKQIRELLDVSRRDI